MNKIQDLLKYRVFVRYGVFILFTGTLLYIIYLLLTNLSDIAGAVVAALGSLSAALAPLIIGLIIAYIINPLVTVVENKIGRKIVRIPEDPDKVPKALRRIRVVSVFLAYIIIIVLIILLIYALAALLVGRLIFSLNLPEIYDQIVTSILAYQESINKWVGNFPSGVFVEQLDEVVQSIIQWITASLSAKFALSLISSVGISIFNFVIGVIVSIYLSIDKDFFIRLWYKAMSLILSDKNSLALDSTLKEVNGVTSRFMRGVLLDAFIVAMLSTVALMISGLEFAIFVGIFAGICNIIPYFGPIIGMIPAFIIGFLTDGVWQGVLAVIVLLVIQQIDGNFIYPRVVGSSTGLHPLFVLLAVSIGGFYAGLLGMVLAVPIAGILQIFIRRWAVAKEQKKLAAKGAEV